MAGRYQEQHPIPQNISSYQFRLVGDMTLKQFFQVAGGALTALLLYSTQLATFIKWPLMFMAFLFGVALAFLPLEDRPLEKWIVLFFKAIYSPTQFKWQSGTKTQYFADESTNTVDPNANAAESAQLAVAQANASQPSSAPVGMHAEAAVALTDLEASEKEYLSTIQAQFTNPSGINQPVTSLQSNGTQTISNTPPQQIPQSTTPAIQSVVSNSAVPSSEVQTTPTAHVASNPANQSVTDITVKTTPSPTPHQRQPENTIQSAPSTPPASSSQVPNSSDSQADIQTEPVHANIPSMPTRNNILVGLILDDSDAILDNAILEIRDTGGRPARAMKSNKLGQFSIATPLSEGSYEITVEKDGYTFDTVKIEVTDGIIDPLIIKAKPKNS